MISERKQFILQTIIDEYLKTAQPVSSGSLVKKYNLDISPATVRNEMMELEADGFIYQPHISSGRIPTESAYRLMLANIKSEKREKFIKEAEIKLLEKVFNGQEDSFRQTAKVIAELADGAVFWAFHKNDLYYTGLSNLFSQPEFKQVTAVYDVSSIIDRLEEIIDEIFEDLEEGEQVLIGEDNPFGNFLSTALVKYKHNNSHGILGILGPMRMNYGRNLALVEFIKKKFD
ncbi:MAG: heat-inducible transcriptional repressor [Patescibacteria group bacterium]|nr:heat-inducible transcriptional repressor [Patescibacteria group bacterium]